MAIRPGDLTYPEHLTIGTGKYINSLMNRAPDFSGSNQLFSQLSNMGPFARGGQFYDPSQVQQYATPDYLTARGDIAQASIKNMFDLANLSVMAGGLRGQQAAMIPELQAQQIQSQMSGIFGGLF